MKTLDEVIESITQKSGLEIRDARKPEKDRFWVDRETYNDALAYLRMYKELGDDSARYAVWRENPPLTWDELRQMEGKPVWVDPFKAKALHTPGWCLVGRSTFTTWAGVESCSLVKVGVTYALPIAEYGKTWQAYRKERTDD